jgi:hypothetical protein
MFFSSSRRAKKQHQRSKKEKLMSRKRTTTLIVLAITAGILVAAPCLATTWTAAPDFHAAYAGTGYTYGPWSYGYTDNVSLDLSGGYSFGLMSARDGSADYDRMSGIPGSDVNGMIIRNNTDTEWNGIAPYGMALHPGSNNYKTVLRFTASTAGLYSVDSRFELQWIGQETQWGTLSGQSDSHVIKYVNSTSVSQLAGKILLSGDSTLSYIDSVSLNAGESIDFILGEGGNGYLYDITRVAVTVTSQDVPEPGSMLALGTGFVGLIGFVVRKRR